MCNFFFFFFEYVRFVFVLHLRNVFIMDVDACNQINVLNNYARLEEQEIQPLMIKLFWESHGIRNSKDRGTDKTYKKIC